MKRPIILLLAFLFIMTSVFSQEEIFLADGTPLEQLDAPYISVFPCTTLRNGLPYRVQIEYKPRLRSLIQDEFIYDRNGQVLFESRTAVLNFMHQNGYRLIQAIQDPDGQIQYYIMERRDYTN